MNWFNQLSRSEKKLIRYGSILISVVLLWLYVYKPINNTIQLKSKLLSTLSIQYNEMESSQKLFKENLLNNSKYHRIEGKPFVTWIDEQLSKNQLSQFVTRSEPKDNQTLILTFESIVFDDLIKWLQPLEQNYGISISEIDINLIDRKNGLCNARITLEEE